MNPYVPRILSVEEKQFLSPEAQEVAYHYFITEEIPLEVTEKAILQAQVLSGFGVRTISGEMLSQLINANIFDDFSKLSAQLPSKDLMHRVL
jgi:hypothetical protein